MKETGVKTVTLGQRTKKAFRRDWQLMVLCILPVAYFIIFYYIPMYGVQIAFKNFRAVDGIWGSAWVDSSISRDSSIHHSSGHC